jgi:hypothetical protein
VRATKNEVPVIGGAPFCKLARGGHRHAGATVVLTKPLVAALAALVVGIAVPAMSGEAPHGETAITCTNPVSGANWQIRIDYGRSTVDSNPARISDAEISWRDANGWNYRLDRKSGELTVVLASATGGNFLHDRCKLEK